MAVKKNPFIETLQQALIDAGYTTTVTGVWGRQDIGALNKFQRDHGLPEMQNPSAEALALLEIHPTGWTAIAKATGAPQSLIDQIGEIANKQIMLEVAEGMQKTFEPAKAEVSRVGIDLRTGMPTPMVPAGRVGERVPYVPPTPTAERPVPMTPEEAAAAAAMMPTEPLLAEKKFKMPTWGWVAIGAGGLVVVSAVGYAIWKSRQPSPAMADWDW